AAAPRVVSHRLRGLNIARSFAAGRNSIEGWPRDGQGRPRDGQGMAQRLRRYGAKGRGSMAASDLEQATGAPGPGFPLTLQWCCSTASCSGGSSLRCMATIGLGFLLVAAVGWPQRSALGDDESADLLLVLAADVSRSVDDRKFRLQREGYATAIVDPRVVRAMTAGPAGRIALCFPEWASGGAALTIIDWTRVGR